MKIKSARQNFAWSLVVVAGLLSTIAAKPKPQPKLQPKPTPVGPVVDVVTLKSGRSLRGGIVWRDPSGSLTMAVSRSWLQTSVPHEAETTLSENIKARQLAWTQTRDRIVERLKAVDDPPRLVFFLKQELERIEQLIGNRKNDDPDFLWVDVAHPTIAKLHLAKPDQRQLALFAWDARLSDVETRDGMSLKKEMNGKGIKIDVSAPDLSDRLPARSQDEKEWAVRMALVEYAISKPFDFQGIGDALLRTEGDRPANISDILPKVFQQQLGSLIKDLANDGRQIGNQQRPEAWLKSLIRQAESANNHGFRVTRVNLDKVPSLVTVESRFVADAGNGNWQTLWQSSVTEDGTMARPDVETRIEQDPQLKTALESAKSLGLIDSNTLQQAIRVGAATMAAQQNVDARFAEFRDRYTRHLDGPPLWMTAGQ